MNKLGIDGHAIFGAAGTVATAMTPHEIIACFVGVATGVYMVLRGVREYVKLRRELKGSQKPTDENET